MNLPPPTQAVLAPEPTCRSSIRYTPQLPTRSRFMRQQAHRKQMQCFTELPQAPEPGQHDRAQVGCRLDAGWMHTLDVKHDTLTQDNCYCFATARKEKADILVSLTAAIELCTDLSGTPTEPQLWPQFWLPQV